MTSIRRSLLLAGAAALLSSQAVYAAPAPSIDPLVALAVLGGEQSNSAVCAGSTAAAAAAAAAAAQAPAPGCVLPVTAPPPPAPVAEAVPPPPPIVQAGAPKTIGTLPILLGLAAIIGVIALIISSNDNGNGNPVPISPA